MKQGDNLSDIVSRAMNCAATFKDVMEVSLHNPLVHNLLRLAEKTRTTDRQLLCSAVVLLAKQNADQVTKAVHDWECRPVPRYSGQTTCTKCGARRPFSDMIKGMCPECWGQTTPFDQPDTQE